MAEENGVHELSREENKCLTLLPLSRIKNIMKQCPDINAISQESLFIITRATELFVELMTREAYDVMDESYKVSGGRMNEVVYKDLASVVDKYDCLMFLSDIVPQKITVREYYKILQEEDSAQSESADSAA
ncbi:uncharacterized protein LOC134819414 [Bolinopsis microptera]|uniref:uncharacterized protein LOC134819414 n=1 Tax=Bolinopsis microptera TaxID=2820187 RepID=UPI003079A805